MTRPYLRGRRRYLLLHWEPAEALTKGALIALVRERLVAASRERAPAVGAMVKSIPPSLVRFEPPWAAVMVDHRFQQAARERMNGVSWHRARVTTRASSGTLRALWAHRGKVATKGSPAEEGDLVRAGDQSSPGERGFRGG